MWKWRLVRHGSDPRERSEGGPGGGEVSGHPRELAQASSRGQRGADGAGSAAIWLSSPSGVCPGPLLWSGLPGPHLLVAGPPQAKSAFRVSVFASVKWGDSSTGLWGGLREVMSAGSPAPEKASGDPWPLLVCLPGKRGGVDVSWWARLTLPGDDEDPVRAGCDPGKPGAGGTASPCDHAILEEERSSGRWPGRGRPPCAPMSILAMAFNGPSCVPQGQSLFVLHAARCTLSS